jgi:hypothetical protein
MMRRLFCRANIIAESSPPSLIPLLMLKLKTLNKTPEMHRFLNSKDFVRSDHDTCFLRCSYGRKSDCAVPAVDSLDK